MSQVFISARMFLFLLAVGLLGPQTPDVISADLKPKTLEACAHYVQVREAAIQKELARPKEFLYVEGLPEPRRAQVMAGLKRGDLFMERLHVRDASGREIQAPDGIIHHWLGAVFIPGSNLRQTLELVQDYDHHQDIYKPEVVRSRLLTHDGNDFKIYYRLRKHKVITVTLNTEHDVHYFPVDAAHCHSLSVATRIAEVSGADTPNEHEKPIGHDGGFLWRMNSYWRFEEAEGGVFVECESISLTRDIPTGLGWLIRPFITDIPKESLQMTLGSTRAALEARLHGQGQ